MTCAITSKGGNSISKSTFGNHFLHRVKNWQNEQTSFSLSHIRGPLNITLLFDGPVQEVAPYNVGMNGGKTMDEEIKFEKMIETMYSHVSDNLPEDVCRSCPVIQMIRDVRDIVKDANAEKIAYELGISFDAMKCPCSK